MTSSLGTLKNKLLVLGVVDRHAEAFHRVQSNYQYYQLPKKEISDTFIWKDRVQCYAGDLRLPKMGLSDSEYESQIRARNVISVFHNAAEVNSAKSYSALREANVTATSHMLAIAAQFDGEESFLRKKKKRSFVCN